MASEKSCISCPNWREGGGGEVIWIKSKRTAVFPRESVPKVGVVSSGSGATGHCAGANRPGSSKSEIRGLLSAFKHFALAHPPFPSPGEVLERVSVEQDLSRCHFPQGFILGLKTT